MIEDWLFRFRIKKGTRAKPPDNLVDVAFQYKSFNGFYWTVPSFPDGPKINDYYNSEDWLLVETEFLNKRVSNYCYSLNKFHPMHEWLLHCEGPWKITIDKKEKQIYIIFARKTDAAMFRIMSA